MFAAAISVAVYRNGALSGDQTRWHFELSIVTFNEGSGLMRGKREFSVNAPSISGYICRQSAIPHFLRAGFMVHKGENVYAACHRLR
jgi:hypothetical protein